MGADRVLSMTDVAVGRATRFITGATLKAGHRRDVYLSIPDAAIVPTFTSDIHQEIEKSEFADCE